MAPYGDISRLGEARNQPRPQSFLSLRYFSVSQFLDFINIKNLKITKRQEALGTRLTRNLKFGMEVASNKIS